MIVATAHVNRVSIAMFLLLTLASAALWLFTGSRWVAYDLPPSSGPGAFPTAYRIAISGGSIVLSTTCCSRQGWSRGVIPATEARTWLPAFSRGGMGEWRASLPSWIITCAAGLLFAAQWQPFSSVWRCRRCGYDMRGLPRAACPECGAAESR